MGAWSDLPYELASTIVHYLDMRQKWPPGDHQVNRDVLHCTSVSHQFRAIAEPIFYREVHLSGDWRDHAKIHRRLRRFTRTITSRPELGLLVKHLHGSNLDEEDDGEQRLEELVELCSSTVGASESAKLLGLMNDKARDDVQFLLLNIERKGLPNGLLLRGGAHGLAILLLHQLAALQILSLETYAALPMIAFASLGYFIGGVPAGLKSLRQISVLWGSDEASLS